MAVTTPSHSNMRAFIGAFSNYLLNSATNTRYYDSFANTPIARIQDFFASTAIYAHNHPAQLLQSDCAHTSLITLFRRESFLNHQAELLRHFQILARRLPSYCQIRLRDLFQSP